MVQYTIWSKPHQAFCTVLTFIFQVQTRQLVKSFEIWNFTKFETIVFLNYFVDTLSKMYHGTFLHGKYQYCDFCEATIWVLI